MQGNTIDKKVRREDHEIAFANRIHQCISNVFIDSPPKSGHI
jgi:hypothetical protein